MSLQWNEILNELLIHCISYLSNASEIYHSSIVCKHWYKIISCDKYASRCWKNSSLWLWNLPEDETRQELKLPPYLSRFFHMGTSDGFDDIVIGDKRERLFLPNLRVLWTMTDIPIAFPVCYNLLVLDLPMSDNSMKHLLPWMPQIRCFNNTDTNVNIDHSSILKLQSVLPKIQYINVVNRILWPSDNQWSSIEIWSEMEYTKWRNGAAIELKALYRARPSLRVIEIPASCVNSWNDFNLWKNLQSLTLIDDIPTFCTQKRAWAVNLLELNLLSCNNSGLYWTDTLLITLSLRFPRLKQFKFETHMSHPNSEIQTTFTADVVKHWMENWKDIQLLLIYLSDATIWWSLWIEYQLPITTKQQFLNCTQKSSTQHWWLNNGPTELTNKQEESLNCIDPSQLRLSAYYNYLHLQALSHTQ